MNLIRVDERLAVGEAIEHLPEKFRKHDALRAAGRIAPNIHGHTLRFALIALERHGMIRSTAVANVYVKTEKYSSWREAIML